MHGLHILAFPCNQFGKQEPGTSTEIREFVAEYGLSINEDDSRFHLMEKVHVNGKKTHPVYAFLKKHTGNSKIEWNFATKFVVHCDDATCTMSRHDDVSSLKAIKQAKPPNLPRKKPGGEL